MRRQGAPGVPSHSSNERARTDSGWRAFMTKRVVIIGAGPVGLGAAYRLQELGYSDWAIYERHPYIGGLATSFQDNAGFPYDIGGHVLFFSFPYFDRPVDKVLAR